MKKVEAPRAVPVSAMKMPPAKPLALIEELIGILSPVARPEEVREAKKNITLMDDDDSLWVLLLLEGRVDIWRRHDNLLVVTLFAPFVLGLQGSEFRYNGHYFKTNVQSTLRFVEKELAYKIVTERNLLKEVMDYQSYVNDHMSYMDTMMVNSTAYEMVCMRLIELAAFPDCQEINMCDYILKRTHLARSGVMKLLSELHFGGYIDTSRGKLISLLKPFPKKY